MRKELDVCHADAEEERLARLAAMGVPMVQREEPAPDVIEQAAKLLSMAREKFENLFEGVGEETLAERARRIVGRASVEHLLDRGMVDSPREPTMDYRGRWKFRR